MSAFLQPFRRVSNRFAIARQRLRRAVLARMSFRMVERAALASWLVRAAFNGRVRAVGIARYEAGCADVGLTGRDALSTMSAELREAWIDERLYAARERGRNPCPGLRAPAQMMVERIKTMRALEPKRPVILSPFHYVSQYANIYLVDEVRIGLGLDSMSIVSGVPQDVYGDDHAMIPAIRILHTYDDENPQSRNALGLRVLRGLRREGIAVLFADVPPFTLAKFPMETVGVSMHERHARVHAGVFRIGAPLDAYLLPFYLSFDNGRFGIRMFDPIELGREDAPRRLAEYIDTACKENYPHWFYAGHPCVYHFSPTR
jgi:hypothetical protein